MRKYLLLIKGSFADWNNFSQEKKDLFVSQFGDYAKMLGEKGYLKSGDGCTERSLRIMSSESELEGSRIALSAGDMVTGYFIIEVPSEEIAFSLAKECPAYNCGEYVELVPYS